MGSSPETGACVVALISVKSCTTCAAGVGVGDAVTAVGDAANASVLTAVKKACLLVVLMDQLVGGDWKPST